MAFTLTQYCCLIGKVLGKDLQVMWKFIIHLEPFPMHLLTWSLKILSQTTVITVKKSISHSLLLHCCTLPANKRHEMNACICPAVWWCKLLWCFHIHHEMRRCYRAFQNKWHNPRNKRNLLKRFTFKFTKS